MSANANNLSQVKFEPNYRLTTDSDVEISSNSDAQNTVFSINVSLHPKDIEALLNVFSDFLLNNCQKTNEEHERNKSDYEIIKLAIGKEVKNLTCPECGSTEYEEHEELMYEKGGDDPQYGGALMPVKMGNCRNCG